MLRTLKAAIQANTSDIETINESLEEYEKSIKFQAYQISDVEKTHKRNMKKWRNHLTKNLKCLTRKCYSLKNKTESITFYFMGYPKHGEKLYDKMRRFFVRDLGIEEERAQQNTLSMGIGIQLKVMDQTSLFLL